MSQDVIPQTITADITIDASQEPVLAKKWAAMLRKHGNAAAAVYALLPVHEEHTQWGDVDAEIYDLTDTQVVSMRLPRAILHDIINTAKRKGTTTEQEMASRLGVQMQTAETLL